MPDRLFRAARVRSASFDEKANTIDVVWSTGAAVERCDWYSGEPYLEVLSLAPDAVRLGRLNSGAPFLDSHDSSTTGKVIGSVVPGSASVDGERGICTILLSRAASDRDTVGKIKDGIIRNVSVGYQTHAEDETERNGVTIRTATDWEPLEISAVPIPADAGAQIRSASGRATTAPASGRVAAIRRMARKAGLPNFGEKHVRAGTSAADFFTLAAKRLAGERSTPEDNMSQSAFGSRGFLSGVAKGAASARKALGRDEEEDKKGGKDRPDQEPDERDEDEGDELDATGNVVSDEDDEPSDDESAKPRKGSDARDFALGAASARRLLGKR